MSDRRLTGHVLRLLAWIEDVTLDREFELDVLLTAESGDGIKSEMERMKWIFGDVRVAKNNTQLTSWWGSTGVETGRTDQMNLEKIKQSTKRQLLTSRRDKSKFWLTTWNRFCCTSKLSKKMYHKVLKTTNLFFPILNKFDKILQVKEQMNPFAWWNANEANNCLWTWFGAVQCITMYR